jgi:hypothetical protein
MKEYQIKVTSVDYDVTYEDINFDPFDTVFNDDAEMDEAERKADEEIAKIKSELPQELDLEITCEPEDLEDEIADAISNETNWLVNSFTYDVVSEKESDYDDYEDYYGDIDDDNDEESESGFFENIEIEVKGNTVYLAHDGSSGCEYEFKSKDELKQIIADYVADVIDYDYED